MTKQEAIQSMKDGKKVTHRYFTADEWMTMEDGIIVLEDGVKCTPHEFWFWRWAPEFNDGYEIYNENNK